MSDSSSYQVSEAKIRSYQDLIWFLQLGRPTTCSEFSEEMEVPNKTAWRRLRNWESAGLARRLPGRVPGKGRAQIWEATARLVWVEGPDE